VQKNGCKTALSKFELKAPIPIENRKQLKPEYPLKASQTEIALY